eukprot:361510-Chlamydomonas_euryale.AAC.1
MDEHQTVHVAKVHPYTHNAVCAFSPPCSPACMSCCSRCKKIASPAVTACNTWLATKERVLRNCARLRKRSCTRQHVTATCTPEMEMLPQPCACSFRKSRVEGAE